ncbi:MAG: non-homologous end-joining DNA ligase [Actinomycetota bacterium]|nr:non-homologous end-joining DNA ligase [Actinomycetota bacterium]
MSGDRVRFGRYTIEVSNRTKVLFPGDGITKGDLIEYYAAIAERMVPLISGRPLSLERFPEGIDGHRVFQQNVPTYFPAWVRRVNVRKEGGRLDHVVCENAATLAYLANQAVITPHAWLSRADRPEHPDQLIFDLDPPGDEFEAARAAARSVRTLLDELGLPAFLKTSGGKGLHVMVPLDRKEPFEAVRSFARDAAAELARREPERLTTETRKAKRDGRLFLDVGRNAYAQTAVPPFAVRPRPGAPVATPIPWDELEDPKLLPGRFTIRSVFEHLDPDPWRDARRQARSLAEPRRRLARIREQER